MVANSHVLTRAAWLCDVFFVLQCICLYLEHGDLYDGSSKLFRQVHRWLFFGSIFLRVVRTASCHACAESTVMSARQVLYVPTAVFSFGDSFAQQPLIACAVLAPFLGFDSGYLAFHFGASLRRRKAVADAVSASKLDASAPVANERIQ